MMKQCHQNKKAAKSLQKVGSIGRVAGIALVISTAISSGCASYNRDHFTVGSVPDDYRTRHPIIVSESERSQDIVVPSHSRSLPLRGRDIVRSMGYKFKASGARSIAILIPSGSANEKAARLSAQDAVTELKTAGISSRHIIVKHYDAAGHGASATLRVVFTDLTASVDSQCGEWNEDILETTANNNYSNFGCATQNNLAQLIANPADLLGPRGMSEIDSTKRTAVIEDWRTTTTDLEDLAD